MTTLDITDYGPDQFQLSNSQKRRIATFSADNMERDPQYVVNGFASSSADHEYNLALSTERASEVAKALIEFGVPNDKILLRAFGERFFSGNSESFQVRRAVTINVI